MKTQSRRVTLILRFAVMLAIAFAISVAGWSAGKDCQGCSCARAET